MGGGWVWVSGWEGGGGGTKAETEKEVLKRFLLHFLPWEKFLEVRAINFHAIKPVEPPFLWAHRPNQVIKIGLAFLHQLVREQEEYNMWIWSLEFYDDEDKDRGSN